MEVIFGAKYPIAATTEIAKRVKTIVAPCAILKAAPEFLRSVNWRRFPINLTGFRESSELSAQLFVAKSKSQIAHAIV
jgi:hypothetical protein